MKKLKKEKGFTLIELIVVIAMLAILASVSIGGFEYSQKRAAIENDKALVNQLNRVLDSYGIFTHNEGDIHNALIEEFGNTIEIQSLKFGYDIYCYKDLCEFYLLDKDVYKDNDNYLNLWHYLNFQKTETDDNIETNELIINFANIPDNKIHTIEIVVNLETNETVEACFTLEDNVTLLSCEPLDYVDYVEYIPYDDKKDNKNIYFYTPGVYLIKYLKNGTPDYLVIYVTNKYIEQKHSDSIGIDASSVTHTIYYDNSQIKLTLLDTLYYLRFTDYNIREFNLESISLADFNYSLNRIMLIIEIDGNYNSVYIENKNISYEFTFDNIDIGEASKAIITYRYFGNDGIWHYSDEIEIDIHREN